MRSATRRTTTVFLVVLAITTVVSCSDGGGGDGSGSGGAETEEVSLEDPCSWATPDDFAEAGFTMELAAADPDAVENDGADRPACLFRFQDGGSITIIQVSTGPKDDLPLVFEANGDREVDDVGERMIVQPESDENGRSTTVTVVLADRTFRVNVGEQLAAEDAVVAIATTMARKAGDAG